MIHFCAGSILTKYHILTSAICVEVVEGMKRDLQKDDRLPPIFVVKAGKINLGKPEDTEQLSHVEKYYKHNLWNGKAFGVSIDDTGDW